MIARHALGEKGHRHPQHLPHIGAAAFQVHFAVDFQAVDGFDPGRRDLGDSHQRHQPQEGHQKLPVFTGEQMVHKEPGEHRVDDAEEVADHRGEHDKDDGRAGAGQALAGKGERALLLSAGFKVFTRGHLQADAGEGVIKLLHGDFDLSPGGIIDPGKLCAEAVQHYKVVEIPVDNAGIGHLCLEGADFTAKGICRKAVIPGRHQDVFRPGPIAGDAAVQAHLFQRDPLSVIRHDHCQGRRTAFQGFHLHDNRDLHMPGGYRLPDFTISHLHIPY